MYKLDRVDKVCIRLVSFDQVSVESVYADILFGSCTYRKRGGGGGAKGIMQTTEI